MAAGSYLSDICKLQNRELVMAPSSPRATEVARGLWGGGAGDSEEVIAGADRICAQLRTGLSRWVGTAGYRSLLHRAVELARAEHPPLSQLSFNGSDVPEISAAMREHGAAEVTAGLVAMVATLIDLLGRIIGEEMAVELVRQAVASTSHRDGKPGAERGRDA